MDEYFIKRTDERLSSIELKLDRLLAFYWQFLGGSVVISAMVAVAIEFLFKK